MNTKENLWSVYCFANNQMRDEPQKVANKPCQVMTNPNLSDCCSLLVTFCVFSHLIGRKTVINILVVFSGIDGFPGETVILNYVQYVHNVCLYMHEETNYLYSVPGSHLPCTGNFSLLS